MATFRPGLFGSSAPQIRRLQSAAMNFAPSIEELRAQQEAMTQAATESAMRSPSRTPRMGAFAQGPQGQTNPAPAPVSSAPSYSTPSTSQGGQSQQKKESNPLLDAFGYNPDKTDMGGLEWWFSSPERRDQARAEFAGARAAEAEAQRRSQVSTALEQAGFKPHEIAAYFANEAENSKAIAENWKPQSITKGNTLRMGNGETLYAPDVGVDGGQGYTTTPDGVVWGDMRDQSYAERNTATQNTETGRHNRAQEGIDRDKAATEAAKNGVPDFGNENQLRNQYLGQAKTFQEVRDARNRVQSLSPDMNPPEQMALVFSVMKMLDPGSTVREGEYATAQNTTGAMGTFWNLYNKAKDGQFLNEDQVKQFRSLVDNQYKAQEDSYAKTYDFYRSQAPRYGMSPDIIQDLRPPRQPTQSENLLNAFGTFGRGMINGLMPQQSPQGRPMQPARPVAPAAVPAGVDPADWQFMTPEQKALFQ